MPCPLFEPRLKALSSSEIYVRVPLIFEFEGVCHAGRLEHSSYYCNHGYAKGNCSHFPAEMPVSAVRFSVTGKTPSSLTVLVIEEENHWPRAWSSFQYALAGELLEPEIDDVCRRAQFIHFCRSYLEKFNANDN